MLKTEPVTVMMLDFASAEGFIINLQEILQKLWSNSIKVQLFLFSQKISTIRLGILNTHDRHFPVSRSRFLLLGFRW